MHWTPTGSVPMEHDEDGAGRLGAGTFGGWRLCICASEILCVVQSSNVYVITLTHYFHQSNLYFRQHHFRPEKIYLLRISCIDPASSSVKKGLFSSRQHTLRNNSLHPSQG